MLNAIYVITGEYCVHNLTKKCSNWAFFLSSFKKIHLMHNALKKVNLVKILSQMIQ